MELTDTVAEQILAEARQLRTGNCIVAVELLGQGRSHDIYHVTLPDSSYVVARVARAGGSRKLERRAIEVLKHIKLLKPDCQIPQIHWDNLDQSENNCLIVFEDLIKGSALCVWNHKTPQSQRNAFLDSLAQFLLDTWSVGIPKSMSDAGGSASYSAWLENEVDRAIRRCMLRSARWGSTMDYLVMRSMIPRDLDHISLSGIAHGDMNAQNFIVDDKTNLQGVVDWDWTFAGPLPAVVQYPWFIADVPGWHNEGTGDKETFEADRAYLVEALRVRETSAGLENTLSDLLVTARERQIFQAAISFRDIHAEFVLSHDMVSHKALEGAKTQLESFLEKHPSFKDLPEARWNVLLGPG